MAGGGRNGNAALTTPNILTGSGALTPGPNGFTLNTSAGAEFCVSVSGAGALTKNGAFDLAPYNANTYSGGTVLNAGRLLIANNAALGTGTITI